MKRIVYSKWDGTQQVYDLDEQELLDSLADYFIQTGDLNWALNMLMQRGFTTSDGQHVPGIEDLIQQIQKMKEELFSKYSGHPAQEEIEEELNRFDEQQMQKIKDLLEQLRRKLAEKQAQGEATSDEQSKPLDQLTGQGDRQGLEELMERLTGDTSQGQRGLDELQRMLEEALKKLEESGLPGAEESAELGRFGQQMHDLAELKKFLDRNMFDGPEPLSLDEARSLMEKIEALDRLEQSLKQTRWGGDLDQVDEELLEELLGEEARTAFDRLKGLKAMLEEAGLARRQGDKFELTPRGMRKIGEKALKDIFATVDKSHFGKHEARKRGIGLVRSEETRRYQYGDPFSVDLGRTLLNSVQRTPPGQRLNLQPDDFEVYHSEYITQSSTVLMLDMSWSMAWFNRFYAAKKVAMALNELIRSKFPKDKLRMVGFYAFARELQLHELPFTTWMEGTLGTNIQEGLRIASQMLERDRGTNKQVILITDGEPTAHVENGRYFFQYPPSRRTVSATLREVQRCTKKGITINTFMLGGDHYLADFVDQMTRINKGRAFYTTPENLGNYLLVDYITNKRKRIR
jgi:uncharacterized protein with von Willebrand factor type A (vWA) domain